MMKKSLFSIIGSLTLTAGSVLADVVLVSDGFENPTFDGTADRLSTYNLDDQAGSLAPQAYVGGAGFKYQVKVDPANAANTVVQTFGDNEELLFGYATNFEYSQMSIEVDISVGTTEWNSLVIGNTAAASQTGSGLFAVRLTSAGDVVVQLEGSDVSDPTLTFSGLVPTTFALNTIRVDFANTAYDGTGTATLDLFVNDVQLDLDTAGAGMSYTRTGFTDNFISFATQAADVSSGFSGGTFDNISIASVAHGTYYYVATDGSDSNDGLSLAAPFRTIAAASAVMQAGDTCYIRGGVYRETITPAVSGTSGAPITYTPYNGESVTISAADPLTGWTVHSGNIYVADMAWDLGEGFNQLFVGDTMMNRARYPNTGSDLLSPNLQNGSITETTVTGAPSKPDNYYAGATVSGLFDNKWTAQTAKITASTGGTLTIGERTEPQHDGNGSYYITGIFEELDSAGEWFYVPAEQKMYLWAEGDADPNTLAVSAKARAWCVNLSGKEYIVVDGIDMIGGSVRLDTSNSQILNSHIQYLSHFTYNTWSSYSKDGGSENGHAGIRINGDNNLIQGCTIEHSAGSGVTIRGADNLITRNIIRYMSYQATYGCPLAIVGSQGNNQVLFNTMHDTARDIMQLGGANNDRIMYNDLYRAGRRNKDLGIIYHWGVDGQGTRIAYNWVHDNLAGVGPGIYHDNFCSHFITDHNVIWNVQTSVRHNGPTTGSKTYNNTVFKANDVGANTYNVGLSKAPAYWIEAYNDLRYDYDAQNNLFLGSSPDAQLEDWGNNDFRLKSGAAAIDAGTNLPPYTDGYLGTAPDLGAYESGRAPWSAGHNGVAAGPIFSIAAASDVALGSATLNGSLITAGSEAATVTLVWGDEDAPLDAAQWDNVVPLGTFAAQVSEDFSESISGLTSDTTYYYRFIVQSGGATSWTDARSFDSFITRFIEEDFESNTLGSEPAGWTISQSPAAFTVQSAAQSPLGEPGDDRGMRLSDDPNVTWERMERGFTAQSGTFYVQFDYYPFTLDGSHALQLGDGSVDSTTKGVDLRMSTRAGVVAGNWYRFTLTIDVGSDTYDVRVRSLEDSSLDATTTNTAFFNAQTELDKLRFHFATGTQDCGGDYALDNIMLVTDATWLSSIPEAESGSASVDEDGSVAVALTGTDFDNDPLFFSITTQPAHGAVSLAGNVATYTPAVDYNGSDSFSFRVSDGTFDSAPAAVTINVLAVNDAPSAVSGAAGVNEDSSVAVTLSGTDVDTGDTLSYAVISGPANGSLSGAAPNLTYTPAANFNGSDSFTFKVNDGTVDSAPATVSLTVYALNDAPVFSADPVAGVDAIQNSSYSGSLSASDVDGDSLSYSKLSGPDWLSVAADGTLGGTPLIGDIGANSWTVQVADGNGGTDQTTLNIDVDADPDPAVRVTEYYLTTGGFTGTTATVTLGQDLVDDYFIFVRGSRVGDGVSYPDNDYARVSAVPGGKGDLADSGATDEIELSRYVADVDWEGVVTVVECGNNASAAGFKLVDIVETSLSGTSGTDLSMNWSDLDQVVLFGGYRGGGASLAVATASYYQGASVYARLYPTGTNTLNWSRDAAGETLVDAVMTTFVVEWGSEWTIQHVNVAGSNGGDGANATNEYATAAISSVSRSNTWVWATGTRMDAGIGDCAESCLVTLGDGVSQNVGESMVAVGSEYTDAYDFDVYALTHAGMQVDHRFKADGDSTGLDVAVTVDSAATGTRFGWVYNGCNGTGAAFPRPRFWARYTGDSEVTISRGYDGQAFPAWVQGVDLSGLND